MERFDVESLRTVDHKEKAPPDSSLSSSSQETRQLLNSSHHHQEEVTDTYDDDVLDIHIAFPLIVMRSRSTDTDNDHEIHDDDEQTDEKKFYSYYYGNFSVIIIQICAFVTFVSLYGIDDRSSNPLIGPPIHVTDKYMSKSPIRIREEHEYWRIVTAMFANVGFLDLFFSICMLCNFGCCLERKWGCKKWLSLYLISGIGGNIYSSFKEQTATSVGNGGCILGLMGAMYVDFVTNIFLWGMPSPANSALAPWKDESFLTCILTVIGLFIGIISVIILEHIYPQGGDVDTTSTMDEIGDAGTSTHHGDGNIMYKDWSVLYGGMLTGILFACIWNVCTLHILIAPPTPPIIKAVKLENVHNDHHPNSTHKNECRLHLTRMELCTRLTMLVIPLLVFECIFSMQ